MSELKQLIEIVKKLRAPDGCDWDNVQTSKSLIPYLLEETYEVIEAIETEDSKLLKEELGDLLLHIIFQSEIAKENNFFELSDSIKHVSDKLVDRHPHIFNSDQDGSYQKGNWELSKQKEKDRKYILEGVPITLPALTRARRIQEKAASVGFDWENIDQVFEKVHEEIEELKDAIKKNDTKNIFEELGDSLFTIVNIARFLDCSKDQENDKLEYDPESALRFAIRKFENRFNQMEDELKSNGKFFKESSLELLDSIWNKIKNEEK
tara:strand:+ start:3130 stop:3924 length:795 start_codon:yes stop_codon:yes gene_type:complete